MNTLTERTEAPAWASRWLVAAGIYNLLWGATTIAFPHFLFDVSSIDRPNYPEIWQCVGMIVGVDSHASDLHFQVEVRSSDGDDS